MCSFRLFFFVGISSSSELMLPLASIPTAVILRIQQFSFVSVLIQCSIHCYCSRPERSKSFVGHGKSFHFKLTASVKWNIGWWERKNLKMHFDFGACHAPTHHHGQLSANISYNVIKNCRDMEGGWNRREEKKTVKRKTPLKLYETKPALNNNHYTERIYKSERPEMHLEHCSSLVEVWVTGGKEKCTKARNAEERNGFRFETLIRMK